jgi:RNA polymerase sigma factor (sigma-70 family)
MDLSSSDIQRIEKQFDHFCKVVLSNEAKDAKRQFNYQRQHEVSLCELSPDEERQLYVQDEYPVFEENILVSDFTIHIHNEQLYGAFLALPERKRNIIVLYFWLGMTDQEIATELHLPRSTINSIRLNTIRKLKKLMEAKEVE